MKRYMGINYEENADCFAKTSSVRSILLYGDPEVIEKPWLTVLVPTYKRADLLEQALNSVLDQWHTDFFWDVVVVDNEPYDGKPNDTEKLIRRLDNPRILYYRNSEHMRPGDNFNRGIFLARGQWVTMLHDDDLLIASALQNLDKLIRFYEKKPGKPLGAISTSYVQFEYDPDKEEAKIDIPGINSYVSFLPTDYKLYKLTHHNILITAHTGGSIPSNGTTFNREAVLDVGGFNDDFGISADLILFYCLENKYSVYYMLTPMGFYRWGCNTMVKPESTYRTIRAGYDFREYAYSRSLFSRIMGAMLRRCHYKKFSTDVIREKRNVSKAKIKLSDFDGIYSKRPWRLTYFFYTKVLLRAYFLHKRKQSKRLAKGAG